ncbi:MAG: hypothetical protein WBY44_31865 [Bryobacteraceae bacterium]
MAFIRKRLSSTRQAYTWYSFQLIESYRDCGRVRQRVLCNIGTARSAAQAAQWYEKRLPEQYRDQILHGLEAMARSEPAIEDGKTLEDLERRIATALGRSVTNVTHGRLS